MEELKNEIEFVFGVDDVPQPEKAVELKVLLTVKYALHSKTFYMYTHLTIFG